MSTIDSIAMPVNEPVRAYSPASPEGQQQRASLQARLDAMAAEKLDIPLVIGGREVRTGNTRKVVMPQLRKVINDTMDFLSVNQSDNDSDIDYADLNILLVDDSEESIRQQIAADPHSTYVVCQESIDHVVGYVDSADLFQRVLTGESILLRGPSAEGLLQRVLVVPDRLTLSEMLKQFRHAHEDFAVIVNEYSLVVGVITLNDVMSTVMGSLMAPLDDEQIVQRDADSWLMPRRGTMCASEFGTFGLATMRLPLMTSHVTEG